MTPIEEIAERKVFPRVMTADEGQTGLESPPSAFKKDMRGKGPHPAGKKWPELRQARRRLKKLKTHGPEGERKNRKRGTLSGGTWGGRREGSGRKSGKRRFQIKLSVPLAIAEAIATIPWKERATYLNRGIELLIMMEPPGEVKPMAPSKRYHRTRMSMLEKARDDITRIIAGGRPAQRRRVKIKPVRRGRRGPRGPYSQRIRKELKITSDLVSPKAK